MQYSTFEAILLMNKYFYDEVGHDFNNTRRHEWKSFADIIKLIVDLKGDRLKILDVACGNGRFINDLNKAKVNYDYLGIDFNDYLLQQAKLKHHSNHIKFRKIDVVNDFIKIKNTFDVVVCFGLMHHLATAELRFKMLEDFIEVLEPHGIIVLSFFDFLEDQRFNAKIISNDKVLKIANWLVSERINDLDLDENDYFLGWGNKEVARYCHYYPLKEKNELVEFMEANNVKLLTKFYSDGVSDKYNSYYIFQKKV